MLRVGFEAAVSIHCWLKGVVIMVIMQCYHVDKPDKYIHRQIYASLIFSCIIFNTDQII